MGLFNSSPPKPPPPPTPPPTREATESDAQAVAAAEKTRLKRRTGLQRTILAGGGAAGDLSAAPVSAPTLLGGSR